MPGDQLENALPRAVQALNAVPEEPPRFLVPGLLPAADIALFAADGGVGKTTCALAIAGAITGMYPVFGHEQMTAETMGSVLFVSEEDPGGVLQNRLRALAAGHRWDPEIVLSSFHYFAQAGVSLDTTEWQEHLAAEVVRIGAVLVVFDPLFELTAAKETSNDEQKTLTRFLRNLTVTTGAGVLLLHHAGKVVEGKRTLDRIRGASALNAAARTIWFLEDADGAVAFQCLKMSRTERPDRFAVRREVTSDPANRALWTSARLDYVTESQVEQESAEGFVLEQLARYGSVNSSTMRKLAERRFNAPAITKAQEHLHLMGRITFEPGPNRSKNWKLVGTSAPAAGDRSEELELEYERIRAKQELST